MSFKLYVTDINGKTRVFGIYPTKSKARKKGLKLKRKYAKIRFKVVQIKLR